MTHCPPLFSIPPATRERVRLAILELLKTEERVSLRALTKAAGVAPASAQVLLKLQREGVLSLANAWNGGMTSDQLSRRIDDATDDTLRAQLCTDLAKAMHQGQVEPSLGRAMAALIAEARHCDRAARESAPIETDAKPIYLLSHEGIVVGRALDFLVSDELRAESIAFMESQARRDLELFPNPTTAEVKALRAEGANREL